VVEYVDRASGSKARRPGLDALVAACRRREVDAVIVVKLDRLARSVAHLVDLSSEFEALGVGLVVLDQGIDTTTPAGKLVFHIFSAVAEFERELIRERVKAGLRSAKRRGVRLGRPSKVDAASRGRARRLRASGRSLRDIAAQLGRGLATVQRALRHE
jgi:DNA invertase Pin-like site-specific DNA recombinase